MDISMGAGTLIAFCLALVRTGSFLVACPIFNASWIPQRVRLGLGMAISVCIAGSFHPPASMASLPQLVVALGLQAIAGLALGFCVGVVFTAVQAAGDLIDLQVGFSFGAQLDPFSGAMAAPTGRMYQMVGVATVFAAGGHVLILRGFLRSLKVVPLGGIDTARLGEHLLALLTSVLIAAVEISLPILAALFCAEVALGLLGKAAPQLNVLVLGFALKTFLAFGLLAATMAALPNASMSLIEQGLRAGFHALTGG